MLILQLVQYGRVPMQSASAFAARGEQEHLPETRRLLLIRCGKLAMALSAVAIVTIAAARYNDVAACRGTGVTTRGSDGTYLTTWSDGAYVKKTSDGSVEWAYPSGTDPVPGASPGHHPH
jgi:hypothetical protein